jgi:hypothetical protein
MKRDMAESYADEDLETLRAMALSAGLPNASEMSHDELVTALRDAGLARPTGKPVDTSPGDPDAGVYHGEGVGRRERVDGEALDGTEAASEARVNTEGGGPA